MSVFDELVDVFENQVIPKQIDLLRQFTIALEEEDNAILNSIEKEIEKIIERDALPTTSQNKSSPQKSLQADPIPISSAQRYTRRNRPQNDALSDIANVVNDHNKQRSTRIKIERATNDNELVKQDIDMPPPTKPPLRNKRRAKNQSVVPEIKLEILDNSVIEIPKAPLDVIVLDDSLENNKPVRATRARTKRKEMFREESESIPENFIAKVKVERTSKRKQIGNNETDTIEISPQKKKMRGDNADVDATVMEVENTTLVNETVSSPMKKKVKGKGAKAKQSSPSTAEHTSIDETTPQVKVKQQSVRGKKQRSKTNSIKGDEEQSTFHRNSTDVEVDPSPKKKGRAKGKKANIKQSKDQSHSHEQDTTEKNAETNSSEGETLVSPQKINGREEDAIAAVSNETVCIANPTILKEKQALANETMVITKPCTVDDLMTDDEDFVPSSPPVYQGKGNQIFSPYESSPVRKRVQAFEKLEAMNAEATSSTRSKAKFPITPKTRAPQIGVEAFVKECQAKEANSAATVTRSKAKLETKVPHMSTSTPNTKIPKLFGTPLTNIKYKNFQTPSKDPSNTMNEKSVTLTAGRTCSALKASKMEFRERELHRKQKEQEAMQKKEALLQSSIEEKRRKREEREMKVQQLKAKKEQEKKRQMMSAEKTKEEKSKQVLAEKDARIIKRKEEAAQKRAAVLKKKENQVPGVIPYLAYPTPPLPTVDNYDSDDSASRATIVIPKFQQKQVREKTLLQMRNLHMHRKELFILDLETPNLMEIFPEIHASKLKRTSSGVWNRTEKSVLELMIEEDEAE